MQLNYNEDEHTNKAGQGFDHLPPSERASAIPLGGGQDFSPASEAMDLAVQVTNTSADVYEIIADVAKCLPDWSNDYGMMGKPDRQHQPAALLKIVEAIKATEMQLRSLDSQTVTERPEILTGFLEDCWTALTTFREVTGRLAEIIGLDGWENPSSTASETLAEILTQLHACSETVSGLPGSGLAVSTRCMAHTALHLQRQAGRLVDKTDRLS